MNELFHPDNPMLRFLSRLFDLMVLNVLFLVSCVPVITIGAAVSSAYQVIFRIIEKKDPYIAKSYLKALKENFKQATILWGFILCAIVCVNAALYAIYRMPGKTYEFLQIPLFLVMFLIASIAVYAFPLLSRYQNRLKQVLKNAVFMSLANIPATVLITLFPLGIWYGAYAFEVRLSTFYSFLFLIGCSGVLYIYAYVLLRIFKKYETK